MLPALQLAARELLLFASFWFLIGAVDEFAVDIGWIWLRLTGRAREAQLAPGAEGRALSGNAAILIPTWREAKVIGDTVAHALSAWRQAQFTLYVGCYRNDPETVAVAVAAAGGDPRLRIVVHERAGPTTKADCLNRLYRAVTDDERRSGVRFACVILHDAEDMVHPAELTVMDEALAHSEFVQIPVRPEPQARSKWIAGHYSDEFAESHGKVLVLRDALGAAIPAAGVGCGFSRETLARIAVTRRAEGGNGPFAEECLTEDYELGLLVGRTGGRSRFLRVRDSDGELVATRAYFPNSLDTAVRQKSRWIHGIALQGWDRLGWAGRPVEWWMAFRDRRGPMIALVLATAYLLLVLEGMIWLLDRLGWVEALPMSGELRTMLEATFAACLWRALWRFGFTAREYGLAEGARSVFRMFVANYVSILAGRKALFAYVRALRGDILRWDKTDHNDHPAASGAGVPAR